MVLARVLTPKWKPSGAYSYLFIWLFSLSLRLNYFHNRFVTHSLCFMDAYWKGLNGKQAAYAARKYHGH
ncbi:hypothetical protein PAXRUDRAFT_173710 [Paxillus rubicundulus Ve08.2h10]|uniref:Uncharacterized protein n=1 Tax=Paxillus rubicundulus Ve08.2h10 TaxID=930991 RepID=A0A0D0CVI7_9AGAM|nr:hypothetical protein PAXRUDRAFT_173710 [Paxillus rubicundulus Ve08.2h10]